MNTGLRPLTLAMLSLGAFACSDLLPEVTSDSLTGNDSSGTNTDGPTTTTGVDPDTTTGVDPDTTGEQTTNVDTTMGSATDTTTGETDTTTSETDTDTDTDGTTTGGSDCIQMSVDEALSQGSGLNFWQTENVSPNIGGPEPEQFRMEFYTSDTGPIVLGAPPNDNFSTCDQCLRLFQDVDGMGGQVSQFFQASGTVDIDAGSAPQVGPIIASTTDVVLVEVTIDAMTLESTPVPDGECIELQNYSTTPNNSCAGMCGDSDPVPGSFPECTCDATCFDSDSCCLDICTAGVCDGEAFCNGDTEVVNAGPGLGLGINDNGYNGTLGSMACETFMIAADGIDTIADVSVEIGMNHSYVGDLVIKVVAPAAANPITVLSRPGRNEPADDGGGGMGDASNLSTSAPITFDDAAPNDAEDMGGSIGDNSEVCVDDGECDFSPNPGSAIAGDFGTLAGQDSVGSWQVCVGDGAGGDFGFVDFIELTIDQVP